MSSPPSCRGTYANKRDNVAAVKVDGGIGLSGDLSGVMKVAAEQEQAGYDGLFVPETQHDPFVALALVAAATESVEVGTNIAVAFARNPLDLAYSANDIQLLSGGRCILGLGSQIKPHITKRFSMEWSKPAARMRELVLAIRAIWDCWNNGTKLDFRGDFYQHTLMTPFLPSWREPEWATEGHARRRRSAHGPRFVARSPMAFSATASPPKSISVRSRFLR